MTPPCFFVFERCEPEDVVYRLDYKNGEESGAYFQLYRDYGWENCGRCLGWLYFRKSAAEADTEIFSDDSSRVDMVDHIVKTRMLPLLCIFFCCLLPNFVRSFESYIPTGFTVFFTVMLVVYLWLFLHCGRKLRALRLKYGEKR